MSKTNNEADTGLGNFANLRRLAYFAAVVEAGSFTAAAERLGITKAVVSQQVARLEREFRTTLLTRTTRRIALTDAGQAFYERCVLVLTEAGAAFDQLAELAVEPSGTLRLTAPHDYGICAVVPAMTEYMRLHPQCRVDAAFSDQALDLMAERVELAIRVGWVTEPGLQARQIGTFRQLLVAPAQWRRQTERLKEPHDLAELPFIANTALRDPARWTFSRAAGGAHQKQSVTVQRAMAMDATLAVREAVRGGAGLSVLPDYAVNEDLAEGRLITVLPDWSLPSGGIHAVFPAARFRPAKVRRFVELLQAQEQARASAADAPSGHRQRTR